MRPIRVIQWTTGNIGRRSLHAIIGRTTWSWSAFTRTAPTRWEWTPPSWRAGRSRPAITATNDIDALIALEAGRLLLQPAVAQHRRAGPAAGSRRQRLLQCRLDHRRQADTRGPGPHPKGLREGQFHDLRQRRASRHDQHGRHGAQRVLRAGRRDPDHRVGGLLDLRVGGHADRDGLLPGPGHPRPGRKRAPGKRGVRRVRGDDGRRDRRQARPDDVRRHLHRRHRRQRSRLHADPEGHRGRRHAATTAAGSATRTSSASDSTGSWAIT